VFAVAIETPATTPAEVLRLAIVGIIPVGLANLAWDHGVRHGDTVFLAGLSFIEPILSTFWIALFLSRPVGATEILAIALVLCAVALSFASERQRRLGRR
jgi:drug/metabolite transporter (DMT)-like permease